MVTEEVLVFFSLCAYIYLLTIVDLLANAFLAWIQAKNEAEAEAEEKILEAHKYYQRKLKRKIIKNWKVPSNIFTTYIIYKCQ